jgi:hypothetical protein
MQFRLAVLVALCSLFLPLTQAFAIWAPAVSLFADSFTRADPTWRPDVGTWSISHGIYGNAAAGSSSISVPRNTWFDVVVQSIDHHTFISVNDVALVQDLAKGELGAGSIGVITHWSKGRFDNVVLTSLPVPYASEL